MRKQSALKLLRSPLIFVLVQVRFSPVKLMREYVPKLQDYFRKSGFPRCEEEQFQQVIFGPKTETQTGSRWNLVSRDKREGIVLTEDFVVFEMSRYDLFDDFVTKFKDVLTKLHEVADIEFVNQIGLRYVDFIQTLDGHPPEWFLRQEVRGLQPSSLGADQVVNQFMAAIKTSEGELRLSAFDGTGPEFMPPGLNATRLEFDNQRNNDDPFRVLDFDHIWRGEMDFVVEEIMAKMWGLHEFIGKAFQATVTTDAMKVWEKAGAEQ